MLKLNLKMLKLNTFKTSALFSPVTKNATFLALLSTGIETVIRSGGGFGDSSIEQIQFVFS